MNVGASQATSVPSLTLRIALTALLPFGLGYFLSYLFRAVNAVVAPDLVAELKLDAGQLGFLTAAYLLAFSLFQLPLGVLLDRYGPRRVQAALLGVSALGALLFSFGQDALSLTLARALIGLGFAGGLMSSLKAVVVWVPEARRALASAGVMSLGAIGLMVSTAPMQWAVAAVGWRTAFVALAAMTAVVALILLLVVPRPDTTAEPQPLGQQIRSVAKIMADPAFVRLAPMLGLSAGTHIAIQTLWAGPWWRDMGGLDAAGVGQRLFLMAAAFFVGILSTGALVDRLNRRGISTLDILLGFLAVFFTAQVLIVLQIAVLPAWLAFGMLGQVAVLAFPWLAGYFGAHLSGRANSSMNLMIFVTAFAVQWAIGGIIDQYPRTPSGGFPPEAYRMAFGLFLGVQVAGLLFYLPVHGRLRARGKAMA